ncbi:MAG: nucleotidyl transferase AbiEii/AbiGii toxin family protein [Patulibacter sp.]|nr:nucleotidyl transferase AbiEii/AbiGii toxin family protein [Patulibacter sp.]
MVIATVLDRVRNERDEPLFLLKGGAAMELRLGLQARATKDFDVSFRERMDELLVHLDTALRQPYGDFAVTRSEVTPIGPTASQRLDVKLAYRGRSWQTVRLEIAPAEGAAGQDVDPVAGVPLDRFGLEALERVPCVSVGIAWPPTVVMMEPWRLTYPLEATELDFDPLDVEVAAERVQRVIEEIDAAR